MDNFKIVTKNKKLMKNKKVKEWIKHCESAIIEEIKNSDEMKKFYTDIFFGNNLETKKTRQK